MANQSRDVGVIRYVGNHRLRGMAFVDNTARGGLGSFAVDIANQYRCALGREQPGARLANAFAGTRYDYTTLIKIRS